MKPDPRHQANLQLLLKCQAAEIKQRVNITDFENSDYIASEVLVSLIRMRFGAGNGLLDVIVNTLHSRLMRLIQRYFQKNPQWYSVVNSSSETLIEVTTSTWVALLNDVNTVSFAEVRFLGWVEARTVDYFKGQLAYKNQMPSYESITAVDEDGNETVQGNLLESDELDEPDLVFERKELSQSLAKLMMSWEPNIRQAVYYRLECDYDWEKTAALLNVSKPTAKKYYNIGIDALKGATNE